MKMGGRIGCLVLALLLAVQMVPGVAFAAEEVLQETVVEEVMLPGSETSAEAVSTFALDSQGKVLLRYGNYEEWIDRLDLTGADYARNFYAWLEDNAVASGALADYTRNTTVLTSGSETYYVYKVAEFENNNVGTAASLDAAKVLAEKEVQENKDTAVAHINAVFNAFDRDHPEVFWLSGASNVLNGYSYGIASGRAYYSQSVYFILKSSTFDIRAEGYQSTANVKNAVAKRDSNVSKILEKVTGGTRYEQVRQMNSVLTRTNSYNSNVSKAGNDSHECISALEGRTGTAGPVCEGYARAFKVLCDRMGIPCTLVDGHAKNSASHAGEAHMWNYVQLEDGKWYAVDVTWNDPVSGSSSAANSGLECENYLLVGGETWISGMKFLTSHPEENRVSYNGTAFTNGPVLANSAYLTGVYIPVEGISLNYSKVTLNTGEDVTLTASLQPSDATVTVVWSSSNEAVAKVSNGRVTAVAPGTAAITAKAGNCSVTCTVTVKKPTPVYTLPTAKTLTYTGQAQALVNGGTVSYGTVTYSLDGKNYGDAVPQARDAGTYTVYYQVKNLENAVVKEGTIAVTVAPKTVTAKLSGSVSKVYDGTVKVPGNHGLAVTLNGILAGDDVTAEASYAFASAEVGTTLVTAYEITLSGEDSGNYVLKATQASANLGNITAPGSCLHEQTVLVGKKEADCQSEGYTGDEVCGECGVTVAFGETLPKTDHLEMVVAAVPATCTSTGLTQGSRCAECGTVLKDQTVVQKKPHTVITDSAVEATCTTAGMTEGSHCYVCSKVFTAQVTVPARGHDFVDGVCSRCHYDENAGAEEPEVPEEPVRPEDPVEPSEPIKPTPVDDTVTRIWGVGRCETARKVADALKKELNIEKFDAIIYTSGTGFADALSGSYLSAQKNAPILLHMDGDLADNIAYMKENLADNGMIYILGGSAVVPDHVEAKMKSAGIAELQITRVKGNDRYQTNIEILKAGGFNGGVMLICAANNFADSLSASATGLPILLVDKSWEDLSGKQKSYLKDFTCEFIIIGGNMAVSKKLQETLRVQNEDRVYGETRLETSVKVAERFFADANPKEAVLALSENFPDGLSGGALAHAKNVPLILTKSGSNKENGKEVLYAKVARGYTSAAGIRSGTVLGGSGLIDDTAVRCVFDMAETDMILKNGPEK